jgi:signal transduction histidine kinase
LRAWKIAQAAGLWTGVGLFFATASYMWSMSSHRGNALWTEALRNTLPMAYVWAILTPFIFWTDRRIGTRYRRLGQRIFAHLPACLFWTAVQQTVVLFVNAWMEGHPRLTWHMLAGMIYGAFQWNAPIYWAITGASIAGDYYRDSRRREVKEAQLEQLLAEARLQALRAQLNPHFLFNALNAISAYVEREPRRARAMIEHLADFLRISLGGPDSQATTLQRELDALEHYLSIQRARFEDRLQVSMDIEPGTLRARVPTLILQPLVENAIGHGVAPRASAGSVVISAHRNNGSLALSVRDDGPGLPPGWNLLTASRIGLSNTRQRLEHLYPHRHEFAVKNALGGGVVAAIVIPFREDDEQ